MAAGVNQRHAETTGDVFADATAVTVSRRTLRSLQDELDALVSESRRVQSRIGGLRLHGQIPPGSQARETRTRELAAAARELADVRDQVRETRTRILLLRQQIQRDEQRLFKERSARSNVGSS